MNESSNFSPWFCDMFRLQVCSGRKRMKPLCAPHDIYACSLHRSLPSDIGLAWQPRAAIWCLTQFYIPPITITVYDRIIRNDLGAHPNVISLSSMTSEHSRHLAMANCIQPHVLRSWINVLYYNWQTDLHFSKWCHSKCQMISKPLCQT